MAELKKRSELPDETKWDLSSMYESTEQWEADYQKVQELMPKFLKFQGRLGESAETLLAAFREQEELEKVFSNVYTYSHMRSHEDTANTANQGLSDRANSLAAEVFSALAFIAPELLSLPNEKLEGFLKENKDLALYDKVIERLMREKEHVLSLEEENLLARMSEVADAPSTIFSLLTNADMKFPSVEDSAGKKHDVSEGHFRALLESDDRVLRERTYNSLFGTYKSFANTLAASYSSNVKKDVFYANVKKYDSALAMSLAPDNVPLDVYDNLIKAAHENAEQLHRYVALRKRVLGVEELRYYDMFIPITDKVKGEVPYERAQQLALEALAPLGDEYVAAVKRALTENWIDVYPNVGKRSGAYSWGTYTSNPYILLNYNNTLDDVFTLVHELGHSMHSFYTHKNQPAVYGNYTIFVAEVASILNENLLLQKLLEETTDKKQRMALLNHSLDQFRSTFFRQTMFAEFEKTAHAMAEEGQPLTADSMSDVYGGLNEKFYGPELVVDDLLKGEWARIPHFYNSFYVYKYATGFCAALALAHQIRTEGEPAVARYLEFLGKGSSEDPIDLLKGAGVDMSTPKPIEDALAVFKERLDELEALMLEKE
ncbi:MAG: oligoendopeptidase F [Tumebacillaceae bacterium]